MTEPAPTTGFTELDWEAAKGFKRCLENNVLAAIRTNYGNQVCLIGITRGVAQPGDQVRGRAFIPTASQLCCFDPPGSLFDIDPYVPSMREYEGKRSQLGFRAASLAGVKEFRISASPGEFVTYLKEAYTR